MAEIFSGVGTCGVEDSATGANRLNRARFMPGIKARDSRCCMYFFASADLAMLEGVGASGRTSVGCVQNSNPLSRLASKTGERASDAPFCPAASFHSPASKNFWPPLSDDTRRKTHCPIRAFAIQTRGTRRPFRLLSHGEEITRSSTVCSSQVSTTQHGSTVRRGPVLHPALASKQNTMTLLGVQAGIGPLRLTLDLS